MLKEIKQCLFLWLFLLFCADLCAHNHDAPDTSKIPSPIFDENPGLVDLYWKAWHLAWEKVKHQEGIPQTPYMDEGLWDNTIWIWDTEFMVLFCKYAPAIFPGIESLQNFYKVLLDKANTSLRIQHPDNPPFYAWVEYEYYKLTNDKKHLEQLLQNDRYLQRHFQWFEQAKPGDKLHFEHAYIALEKRDLGYKWGGVQSGMDNTPRDYDTQGQMLWVDAAAQQALSALYIFRLAKEIGEKLIAQKYKKRYQTLKQLINTYYWDEADGFYYDILESDTSFVKVKTPASFWVLLAEIPSQEQAERMVAYAADSLHFGGAFPWPTLSRQEPYYSAELGDYWKGAIWLPTAYMGTKALEKYGFYNLANKMAENLVCQMYETYRQYTPHTIWECYSPSLPQPSFRVYGEDVERVREDFCGWSALGPIALFIENILGFYAIDAQRQEVKWNLHHDTRHGIRRLSFGNVVCDIIYDKGEISVDTNEAFVLIVNGKKYKMKRGSNLKKYAPPSNARE